VNYYRRNKNIKIIHRSAPGISALYSVDSLPAKFRVEVYKRNPDLRARAESKSLIDEIVPDTDAINYFETKQLPDGRYLTPEKQREYANNAAILNSIKTLLERHCSHRKRQSKTIKKSGFWEKAAQLLPRINEVCPHSLPENPRRLQDKFNLYLRGGYETLISGKFLNINAAIIDNDVKESVLTQLIADRRNLDDEQIRALYNMVADKMNWGKISRATVGVWRKKLDLITAAGRLGETRFRNQKTMQLKRTKPTAPLLYWTMDGWDVELLYQKTESNSKGHNVTTYSNRLTLVVVLDPCVNYPVGYAIGDHETTELIKAALRNAINHTAELFGQRYKVNQLQTDHYGRGTLKPLYKDVCDKYTPARVKNAKAKVVEPYFHRLNKKYCQLMPNWSGFGITSDKNKQPNVDAMNKFRHSFPDEAGCREQIRRIIEMERADKRDKYLKLFEQLPDERKLILTQEQYLLNFGAETGYTNAIEGQGLRPTLLGVKRNYDCFDMRFREYSHVNWTVKYDPDELNKVLAVSEDGGLRFMLEAKYDQPMALADRKEGDSTALARVNEFNRQLEQKVTDEIVAAQQITQNLFNENPLLDTTLSRLVICDSNGQHKDRRNAKRLAAPKKNIEDINVVAVNSVDVPLDDEKSLKDLY
ncbi:MAG: hypothetical protein LBC49_00985, partial [Bacteroidales bacterium]|jgi:hypothetical protein|nr:hypothetical protein [Bacteroidales bacterium]